MTLAGNDEAIAEIHRTIAGCSAMCRDCMLYVFSVYISYTPVLLPIICYRLYPLAFAAKGR